jgi:aspartyl-tRNA(Asn)/glutamyl-tRNA(Gln) amidotransferase subunit C
MPVDKDTVRRVARLARIAVGEGEVAALQAQLNGILSFVEQLREVDVSGVEPMTTVVAATAMKMREDVVTDGGQPGAVIANAPTRAENFFRVPKVVE